MKRKLLLLLLSSTLLVVSFFDQGFAKGIWQLSDFRVSPLDAKKGQEVTASVSVKNTGTEEKWAVVEFYDDEYGYICASVNNWDVGPGDIWIAAQSWTSHDGKPHKYRAHVYTFGNASGEFADIYPGVGGFVVPVDKLGLLTPYIGLASTITVAIVAASLYVKRVKRREEKQ